MNKTVDILLATYNGEPFLKEQLDSFLAQTFRDWRLLVCDDDSSDGTQKILEDCRSRHPDLIMIIPSEGQNLGARGNFSRLLGKNTF